MPARHHVITLALIALTFTGCATTWPPFTSDPVAPFVTDCPTEGTPLQNATRRACLMQKAYADGMGRASSFQRNNNLALYGLGAAAAGLAMTGTTGVPIIALALASAAGFTANELFVPARAHIEIFEIGARASGCVWSLGNDYVGAAGRIPDLRTARDQLAEARDQLAAAVGALKTQLGQVPADEQATNEWKAAKEVADDADAAVTEATTVVSALNAQIRTLEVTAASEIDRALGTIRVAIKKAALSANPDTATVMNAARSFQADVPSAYTGLVSSRIDTTEKALGVHSAARASRSGRSPAAAARSVAVQQEADKVKLRLAELRAVLSNVRNVSDQAAVPNAQARLQECIGIAQTAPEQKHVKVDPTSVHVKPGDTAKVSVRGGVGPYRATPVGVDASKVDTTVGTVDPNTKVAELVIKPVKDFPAPSRFTVQVSDDGSKLQTPNYLEVWVDAPPKEAPAPISLKATPKDRSDNKLARNGSITFTISGGTPPYSSGGVAATGGAVPDGIAIEPAAGNSLPADNTVKVTATSDAALGPVTALVNDKAGTELRIDIEVMAAGPSRATAGVARASTPEDVYAAQNLLRYRGHDPGPSDGGLGLRTRTAIEGFQKAQGLPVTGTLDPDTRAKLGLAADPLTPVFVIDLQTRLRDRGFYDGPLDGVQGPATTAAIKRFQRGNGLELTGAFDAATRDVLTALRR